MVQEIFPPNGNGIVKNTKEIKPYVTWVPSPPSKKIRKYIEVSVVPPNDIILSNIHSFNNSNLPQLSTYTKILNPPVSPCTKVSLSDDDLDEFILSSENIFSITAVPSYPMPLMSEYDNDLLFACTTGIETTNYLEESIGEYIGIQITIRDIFFYKSYILFSVQQLKGINSTVSEPISLQTHSISVSVSWDLFERSIPIFSQGIISIVILNRMQFFIFTYGKQRGYCKKFYFYW